MSSSRIAPPSDATILNGLRLGRGHGKNSEAAVKRSVKLRCQGADGRELHVTSGRPLKSIEIRLKRGRKTRMVFVSQVETWMNNSVQGCQLLNGFVCFFGDMDRSAIVTVFRLRPSSISQTMAAPLTIDSFAPFHQSGSQMVSCFQQLSCHSWVLMDSEDEATYDAGGLASFRHFANILPTSYFTIHRTSRLFRVPCWFL